MRLDQTISRLFVIAACLLLPAGSVFGQNDGDLKDLLGPGGGFTIGGPEDAEVDVRLVGDELKPGAEVWVAVHVTLPDQFYIYSIRQTDKAFGANTVIKLTESTGLKAIDPTFHPVQKPKEGRDPILDMNLAKFHGEVTWIRKYRITDDADPDSLKIVGGITGQYCSTGKNGVCRFLSRPGQPPHRFEATLEQATVPVAWTEAKAAASTPAVFEYKSRPDNRGKPGPAEVQVKLTPEDAKPGEEVELRVTVVLDEGWHTYSNTMGKDNAAVPTSFEIDRLNGLEQVTTEFTATEKPEIKKLDIAGEKYTQEVYHDRVTWVRRFRVAEGLGQASESVTYGLAGKISYQTCTNISCLRVVSVAFELGTPAAKPVTVAAKAKGQPAVTTASDPTKEGLIPFLIAAVVAGFAALLTPCVFPMIPITVSFFLKQSEKEHHRPVTLASIYCLAIVGTFTFIGMAVAIAFRATELTALANNGWINVFIAGVLVFFGMNLLGLFEIRIPSGLLTWSAGKESQGGIVGVMFMAITFTLVSFTCTFAFVGGLLVMASKGQYYWPLIGLLAFSLAFSLPFFFLALFPSYLQKLPKSGGWMNRVKVTLGMIEVGAAFKFLSVADLAWNPVPAIFDYGLVMSAWVVISICTGMYLLNLYRLPHDTPSETVPVPQLALAMTFLGLAGYLCVGLFAPEKPRGKIWEQIAAFATPTFEGGEGEIGPYLEHDGLQYALDVNEAIKYAKAKKQLLFLDFTGVNCLNCRLMEGRMAQPANRQLLQKFVRVQLFIDKLPHIKDRALGAKLLERNRGLAENWFGDVSMPSYAVVTPDGKTVLSKFIGMEKNEGDFTAFLDAGLKKWKPGATIRTAVSEKKQDDIGPTLDLDGLTFALDYKRAINKAKTTQHPLFLNFTCMGGIGCRIMEERMKQKHNRDVLEAFVRVQLFVDRLPLSDESDLEATLLRQNRELQETWFGDISTPAFAIVTPDGKTILSKFVGTEQNEGDFAAFLEEGLASWKKVAAAETPTKVRVAGQ